MNEFGEIQGEGFRKRGVAQHVAVMRTWSYDYDRLRALSAFRCSGHHGNSLVPVLYSEKIGLIVFALGQDQMTILNLIRQATTQP